MYNLTKQELDNVRSLKTMFQPLLTSAQTFFKGIWAAGNVEVTDALVSKTVVRPCAYGQQRNTNRTILHYYLNGHEKLLKCMFHNCAII